MVNQAVHCSHCQLTDLLESFGRGNETKFGDAVVRDEGVTLIKHNFWSANERLNFTWAQVKIWSAGGGFAIGAKGDDKTYSSMSYIDDANVHILEQAIRMNFKAAGARLLSDLLR